MNILIVTQKYWPEPFRISFTANELVRRGNNVTVLCGIPNYPEGYWYPGYSRKKNRFQNINGVRIIRAFEYPRGKTFFGRFLNYYSFPFSGKRIVRSLNSRFDVVLMNELSPIMGCYPAIEYKRKNGTKILMYEMDLWPESLLAGGINKNSFLFHHYKKVSTVVYSAMDKILVSSLPHKRYISEMIGDETIVDYLPQYSDDPVADRTQPNNKVFHFLFAGNIGKAQSVKTILDAAAILRAHKDVVFDIVGGGIEFDSLVKNKKLRGLSNVVFYGRVDLGQLCPFYKKADAAIVTLSNDDFASMTLPGKVASYLKEGLPIICSANGAANETVSKAGCGLCSNAEDAKTFADNILFFSKLSYKARVCMSDNALKYYKDNMSEKHFFDTLEAQLLVLASK